jgi:serine/threonine protein kinase
MDNKYKDFYKIGEGSFSNIYKAVNIKTNQLVAIKISQNIDYNKLLIRETKIYKYLKNISGIPKLLWCGINSDLYYMVLPLYCGNLQNITLDTPEKVYEIGNTLLSILDDLHKNCIIHRDIKPENIMYNNLGQLTIIDFGLCKIYKNNQNQHIPFKKINNIIGTINYISINIHNLHEPCRADDVESVIYVLIYLLNHNNIDWSTDNNLEDVKTKKENIISNNTIPTKLIDFLIYTRNLAFTDIPKYII